MAERFRRLRFGNADENRQERIIGMSQSPTAQPIASSGVFAAETGKAARAAGVKLQSIQILRAFAAIIVLIAHLEKEIRQAIGSTIVGWTNIEIVGQAGVDIFFVISGFIMVYVTRNLASDYPSAREFMLKRIVRVASIYWILTFITLAISLLAPAAKYHNPTEFFYTIGSFLFIPFAREDGHFTPLLGVGWTLNFEMMFYAVFCLVILTAPKWRIATMTTIFVIMTLVGFVIDRSFQPQIWFWTRPIILEFLAGGLIAFAFIRGVVIPTWTAIVMIVVGLVCLQLSGSLEAPVSFDTRFWAWGGPASLIVAGIVFSRKSPFDFLPSSLAKLAERAGDGSYSLYLVHMFVVRAITLVLERLHLSDALFEILCYVIIIPAALILADILYRTIEIPVNSFGKKLVVRH
jgi:exopolysaccharide production protein ExoZ